MLNMQYMSKAQSFVLNMQHYSFYCNLLYHVEAMQDLEPEVRKSSARTSKRVMAVALRGQDEPARITRQRTRELASADEVPTADPQVGSTEDALMATNDNTQSNNQNEPSTEGK